MTVEQARGFCALAYFDPPEPRYDTLGQLCAAILDNKTQACRPLTLLEQLWFAQLRDGLGHWRYLACVDRNPDTGFFAYVFGRREGSVLVVFRGSELGQCAEGISDWTDNFLAPLCGSLQYRDVERILALFPTQHLTFVGHSKGGHNALYAKAITRRPSACIAFNAQGFGRRQLSSLQKRRLEHNAWHYVVQGDIVGSLLRHPERRVFVRPAGGHSLHALASFSFDESGAPITTLRPLSSYGTELVSRLGLRFNLRKSDLCNAYLARTPADG